MSQEVAMTFFIGVLLILCAVSFMLYLVRGVTHKRLYLFPRDRLGKVAYEEYMKHRAQHYDAQMYVAPWDNLSLDAREEWIQVALTVIVTVTTREG